MELTEHKQQLLKLRILEETAPEKVAEFIDKELLCEYEKNYK